MGAAPGSGGPSPDASPGGVEPTIPTNVRHLWGWAGLYLKYFSWALAPLWETDSHGVCRCPDGESCMNPGKHLVSGLGVVRQESDLPLAWPATDARIAANQIGNAGSVTVNDGSLFNLNSLAEVLRCRGCRT